LSFGLFRVERVRLRGVSGVFHDVDVVEFDGRRYVLVDLSRGDGVDPVLEFVVKFVLCFDLNLPPLVVVGLETKVPEDVEHMVSKCNGVIVRADFISLSKREEGKVCGAQ